MTVKLPFMFNFGLSSYCGYVNTAKQNLGYRFALLFQKYILKIKFNIMALELTDVNFKETVLDSDKLTLVDFWAEWCGPCRAIGPVIAELATEYEGIVNVGKLNVDVNPEVSSTYGITNIPAILFIKNGEVVDRLLGAQPKSNFVKKIEALK